MKDISPKSIDIISLRDKIIQPEEVASMAQQISGWSTESNELSKGKMHFQADQERILIGDATAPLTGTGVFLGLDGTDYEFRAGNPSGAYIHWDGTNLTVSSIILTGGTISYGKTSFSDTVNAGYYISSAGWYVGAASDATKLKYTIADGTFTFVGAITTGTGSSIDGQYLSANSVASASANLALRGWTFTGVFSATNYRVIAWTAGTFTASDGTAYTISAGNTGNMTAVTYIYLDIAISTTVLQSTTTAATAIGNGKVLIAVASNNTDTTSDATVQVFGGTGGQILLVDNISANSASTNEFVSNTAQIANLIVTDAKISTLAVSKLTAGTISSKQITLGITGGAGDSYINSGKTDFTNTDAGFILGLDDSDSDKAKFYIGDSTNYLNWTGSALNIKGSITGSTITGSTLTTGTTGPNVEISASRISQRTGTTEVVYSDVGTYGGFWGIKDTDGDSVAYWAVRESDGSLSFVIEQGSLYVQAEDDVIFVGDTGNDIYPASDNKMSLGLNANRWADVRSVLINGADIGLANDWKLREYPAKKEDIGKPDEWFKKNANMGIQILDDKENLIAVIHKDGYIYCKGFKKLEELN